MDVKKNSFAEKLNRLFEEKRKLDGSRYTQKEAIDGSQGILTRVYLWKLRKGLALNPGYKVILALASFFGIDPTYFLADAETELKLIRKAQENVLLDQITNQSARLDDDSKQIVLYMIDALIRSKE